MSHRDRYTDAAPGHFASSMIGHHEVEAFVPDSPPPRKINWQSDTIEKISDASYSIGKLSSIYKSAELPYPTAFLYKEALDSSRIENISSSLRAAYAVRHENTGVLSDVTSAQYITDYVDAIEYGMLQIEESKPFTREFICNLHEKVMQEDDPEVGQFRTMQNFIGGGRSLESIVYVPPPPEYVDALMDSLLRFMNRTKRMQEYPPIVRAAIAHYQFETIHPFADGNGRVGRILATLQMAHELDMPTAYILLSPRLHRNRRRYYNLLRVVSTKNDWDTWVNFFASMIGEQAEQTTEVISALSDLKNTHSERYETSNSPNMQKLVTYWYKQPYFTVNSVADALDVAYQTASRLIQRAEENGDIKEITGNKRNRLFAATEVTNQLDQLSR